MIIDLVVWFFLCILLPIFLLKKFIPRSTTTNKISSCNIPPSKIETSLLHILINAPKLTRFLSRTVSSVTTTTKNNKQFKQFSLTSYKQTSLQEAISTISSISSAFAALAINSPIAIFAPSSLNWILIAHSAFARGLPITTIYETLGRDALAFALNETASQAIFTTDELIPSILAVVSQTKIKFIFYAVAVPSDPINISQFKTAHPSIHFHSIQDLVALGNSNKTEIVLPQSDDLACIMYTSGSTGAPKGVMLSHRNLVSAVAGANALFLPYISSSDTYLAYLPLAHVLEFTIQHFMIHRGATIGFGHPRTLSDTSVINCKGDLRELRPTIMAGVPAVWENIRKATLSKLASISPIQRSIFNAAFYAKKLLIQAGLPSSFLNPVFFKINQQTGGRLRLALSGGAPMPPESQLFISVCICPIIQGYGMTETCGTLAIQSPIDSGITGSVGAPLPLIEIKLAPVENTSYDPNPSDPSIPPSGEVWARGPPIMKGYYKQPAITAQAFSPDGWFMTGDIGQWRPDGSLVIIDRKKNLVKLSNGEYIALEKLESIYKLSHYVNHICIVADPIQSKIVAIVSPIEKRVRDIASSQSPSITNTDPSYLYKHDTILSTILSDLVSIGKKSNLASAEIVSQIALVHEDWTSENNLLTAAQKINRNHVMKTYAHLVDEMYKKSK